MAGLARRLTIPAGSDADVHSASPYGGYKLSGHGREMGFAIMDALTQEKSVWVSLR